MRTVLVLFALLLSGCVTSSWDQYPPSLYSVLREETPASIVKHEELLGSVLSEAQKEGKKPPAGIAAEYAYYSWRVGKQGKAREALRMEGENYPESRKFLIILDRFLPSLSIVELPAKK